MKIGFLLLLANTAPWNPPSTKTRAIKGREFGLNLNVEERANLLAFLRTL
jgi:hypothetical protein